MSKRSLKPVSETRIDLLKYQRKCGRPECQNALILVLDGLVTDIFDTAHIYADSDDGPRGGGGLNDDEKRAYENLILLCLFCHRHVDGNPKQYPVETLREWKEDALLKAAETGGYSDEELLSLLQQQRPAQPSWQHDTGLRLLRVVSVELTRERWELVEDVKERIIAIEKEEQKRREKEERDKDLKGTMWEGVGDILGGIDHEALIEMTTPLPEQNGRGLGEVRNDIQSMVDLLRHRELLQMWDLWDRWCDHGVALLDGEREFRAQAFTTWLTKEADAWETLIQTLDDYRDVHFPVEVGPNGN